MFFNFFCSSSMVELGISHEPFHSQDLIGNSPYCLPYNSYISSENLVLDQLITP